jgi:hypothetical protein
MVPRKRFSTSTSRSTLIRTETGVGTFRKRLPLSSEEGRPAGDSTLARQLAIIIRTSVRELRQPEFE